MTDKICSKCKINKSVSEFYKRNEGTTCSAENKDDQTTRCAIPHRMIQTTEGGIFQAPPHRIELTDSY